MHACSVWATYLSKSCFGHKKPIEAPSSYMPPPLNRTPAFSPTKITFLRPFVAPVCLTNTTVSGDIFRPPRKAFADRPPSLPLLSSPHLFTRIDFCAPFCPHLFAHKFLSAPPPPHSHVRPHQMQSTASKAGLADLMDGWTDGRIARDVHLF